MKEFKQVIICRGDIKMSKGKLASQVAHASVEAVLLSHKDDIAAWRAQGMRKIVLKVKDLEELLRIKKECEDSGLVVALVTDAGHTQLLPGTVTCLAIGPDKAEKIDKITSYLKLI